MAMQWVEDEQLEQILERKRAKGCSLQAKVKGIEEKMKV